MKIIWLLFVVTINGASFHLNAYSDDDIYITEKLTAVSFCKKTLLSKGKKVIISIGIATNTPNEKVCPGIAATKAAAIEAGGFKCQGLKTNEKYECTEYGWMSYIMDTKSRIGFDHLDFTDLNGYDSVIVYHNKGGEVLCKNDRAELLKIGIKDAECMPRKEFH